MKNTKVKMIVSVRMYVLGFFILSGFFMTSFAQTNEDCLSCHSDESMTMEKNSKEVSIFVNEAVLINSSHKKLSCISCHAGFNPDEIPHKENIQPINCQTCHKDAPLKHSFHSSMMKTGGSSGRPETSCKSCHGTHNVSPSAKVTKGSKNVVVSCQKCHKDQVEKYLTSDHFRSLDKGNTSAPDCISCHKTQISIKGVVKDTLKIKAAQQKLCLSCHLDDPEIRSNTAPSTKFISAYEESVHGIALSRGNNKAASCIDCHSSHDVKDGADELSPVNKFNIPQTCEKCHSEIAKQYRESVHGVSILKGNKDAPVCTDCHGEHNILKHNDPNSPVSFANLSAKVCSPCHSSVRLTEKYGITSDRFKTFSDSYHGLALQGGSLNVANCASCHGVHNIKSSSNPTSTVNKANLVHTCGTCHPGANENFTIGKIHVTMAKEDDPILYWIANAYIILIFSLIGLMFLHNLLDFIKKAKIRKLKQRGIIPHEVHGHSLYLRMSLNERIQHIVLASSFMLLVVTGFMLRFPESWWVSHIRDLSEHAFELRSLLHRIAAVVMVTVSVYHLIYLFFTERGKGLLKDMLPVFKDLTDAIGIVKFNLGLSSEKPKLDRFSYIEKAEYWALVWGTIIMTATGFIMWFDNTFIGLFTKLGWDIARTIHYYEAWLAFLAIIVWHFYFIFFNPDIYPMNLAWIKGTLTEEEMADEHPLELEKLKEAQIKDFSETLEEEDNLRK